MYLVVTDDWNGDSKLVMVIIHKVIEYQFITLSDVL
jgi:hypothetical protein